MTVRRTEVLKLKKSNYLKSNKPDNVEEHEDLETRSVNVPPGSTVCNIADDVILQVENPKDDTFSSDEESYSEVENEDLDYIDDVEEIDADGEQIFPDCEDQRSIEQVDSEVNFAFSRSGGQNQTREATPQLDNPQPKGLKDYVQQTINNKWKEKEAELLEKYGLNKGMENINKTPQKNETQ